MRPFVTRAAHLWFCYLYCVDRIFEKALESLVADNPLSLIGLQCVCTFAFTVPLFCCCTHPNYLIYSERVIIWLWTIWTMMCYERDTWIQINCGRIVDKQNDDELDGWIVAFEAQHLTIQVHHRYLSNGLRYRTCFIKSKVFLFESAQHSSVINFLSCIRKMCRQLP